MWFPEVLAPLIILRFILRLILPSGSMMVIHFTAIAEIAETAETVITEDVRVIPRNRQLGLIETE
jgi:hypothetical protein